MHTSAGGKWLAATVIAASLALALGAARAEPQALALVATQGKVALTCENGECGAEFSTFCLQADRFAPRQGTPYVLAGTGGISLFGTNEKGQEFELEPGDHLKIESRRMHVAVRISVPRRLVEGLGLQGVSLAVGDNVALLPASESGAAAAYDEAELATLTGPLRALGSRLVDRDEKRMVAARITSRMINAVPAGHRGAPDESLWRLALGDAGGAGLPAEAVGLARYAYDICGFVVTRGGPRDLRRCLQSHHDNFIDSLNSKYWQAVKTGS